MVVVPCEVFDGLSCDLVGDEVSVRVGLGAPTVVLVPDRFDDVAACLYHGLALCSQMVSHAVMVAGMDTNHRLMVATAVMSRQATMVFRRVVMLRGLSGPVHDMTAGWFGE